MPSPLINGESYSWSQIELNILGVPVAGVVEIEYEDDQEIEDNYGAGNFPVSRGMGKIKYTGSITLEMNEVVALQNASKTGRLQDIPEFPIIVSWVPNQSNAVVTHKLLSCRFQKTSIKTKTGDMTIPVTLPLKIGQIKFK
jgi:hypothetical protein